MRKKLTIALAVALGLVVVALLGAVGWIYTGGISRTFEANLRSTLASMNVRMEVSRSEVGLRAGTAELDDLKLYVGDDKEPFASVDKLHADFLITSYWSRRIDLKNLVVTRPRVVVRFDEEGHSNLDPIKLPETRGGTDQALTYVMATVAVEDGEVVYGDERRHFEGTVDNLGLSLLPKTGDDNVLYNRLEAAFSGSRLRVDDRELAGIAGEVGADITREGATVDKLNLSSPTGAVSLSGKVTNWRDLAYEFDTGGSISIDQIANLADPESGLSGRAGISGRLVGKGTEYHFEGDLTANDVIASSLRADAVAVGGRLDGDRANYAFEGNASAGSLSAGGADLSGLRFNGRVEGDAGAGTTTVRGHTSVGGASAAGYAASGVEFEGTAAATDGGVKADGGATVARLRGRDLDASGVAYKGTIDASASGASGEGTATVDRLVTQGATASQARFVGKFSSNGTTTGDLALNAVDVRNVRAGAVRARVVASADRIDLSDLRANVYGGTVSGAATVRLSGGASSLAASFNNVSLDQAVGAASADAPRVNGRASGRINLTWPGSNLQAATGKINATVDGSVPSEGGALPINGEVALTAVPGRFRIDRADVTSDGSRVSVTGSVGWNRQADLNVVAESPDANNLQSLVAAFNPSVAKQIVDSGVKLGGAFRFEGRVTGRVTNPNVEGTVNVGDVAYGDAALGAFTARLERAGGTFRLSEGRLTQPDGSQIAFNFELPGTGGQRIAATVNDVAAAPFLNILGLKALQGGTVTGSIDVTLVPGPSGGGGNMILGALSTLARLRGTVDLTVKGSSVGGEPLEDIKIRADLGENAISLSQLRLASARGAVDVTGQFRNVGDLKSFSYEATVNAENVDLKLLEALAAGKAANVALAGRANGVVTVAGSLAQPFSNLSGNLVGTDVVLNGEPVGNPTLALSTSGSIATVRLTADVLGATRELAGTIDIANSELPFDVTLDLNESDFVQYARLVTDVPAGVTGRATGRVRLRGFLGDAIDGTGLAKRTAVEGTLSTLALSVAVDTSGRRYEIANRGDVVVSATPGSLRFDKAVFTGEGTELTVAGDLALAPGATSNLTLAGDVNLALLSSLTPDAFAAGVASIQATVAGTASDPRFTGFATLRDVSFRAVDLPISFYNGSGKILFTANQALVDSFTAQSGGGQIRVGGGALFAGLTPDRWRFDLTADQIRVNYPESVRSVVDGQFVLQGTQQLQVLSGAVNVRRAEFTEDVDLNDLVSIGQNGSIKQPGGRGGGPSSPIRLDLRVEARDSLIIRNNLADAVGSASLALTGPVNDPIIDGRVTVTRGTLQFRQGEYQVTRGVVRFPGRQNGDITFDIQAESDIKGYRVTVGFTGTPDKFYPTFASDPALPQSQIISLVLTGDLGTVDQTSGTRELAQNGISVAGSLIGEAISRSVEKRTDRLFGINRFQIDPLLVGGSDPSARLTLGRRVNKNLSITYSTNINSTQEQVIQLEYRISDRFSIVAAREQNGSFGIDFRVRKRF